MQGQAGRGGTQSHTAAGGECLAPQEFPERLQAADELLEVLGGCGGEEHSAHSMSQYKPSALGKLHGHDENCRRCWVAKVEFREPEV